MTSAEKREFTLKISQANPTQMVVLLYDMLLCYVRDARTALEENDQEKLRAAVGRARRCVTELMHSLDLRYEPAPAMLGLYGFCIRQLAVSEGGKKAEPLEGIEKVIKPLRDAYGQLALRNNAGAVMGNSQIIYAGLTYSRNALTENMADQGANRGMYA